LNAVLRIVDVDCQSLMVYRKTKKMVKMGITDLMPKSKTNQYDDETTDLTKIKSETI